MHDHTISIITTERLGCRRNAFDKTAANRRRGLWHLHRRPLTLCSLATCEWKLKQPQPCPSRSRTTAEQRSLSTRWWIKGKWWHRCCTVWLYLITCTTAWMRKMLQWTKSFWWCTETAILIWFRAKIAIFDFESNIVTTLPIVIMAQSEKTEAQMATLNKINTVVCS